MAASESVPPFFHLAASNIDSSGSYTGVFHHDLSTATADTHVRWWPSTSSQPQTILLFIPGNPGLLDFYLPFLSALHQSFRETGLAILAHAHLGHTPHLNIEKPLGLLHQVEAVIDTFDTIKAYWPGVKVVLLGHSVGSWIATQVLKERPDAVDALFLLFPTISHIVKTPNGRRLSWLFHAPVASLVSRLSILIRPITGPILSLLFPSWPKHQKAVLSSLLRSPRSIYASLTMAQDEMHMITEPDASLLKQHSSKLWFYYANKDDWVGREREKIVQLLSSESDPADIRVVHCTHGSAYRYCKHALASVVHGDLLAAQCSEWLKQGGFFPRGGSVSR